jgi:hypothetical protein
MTKAELEYYADIKAIRKDINRIANVLEEANKRATEKQEDNGK